MRGLAAALVLSLAGALPADASDQVSTPTLWRALRPDGAEAFYKLDGHQQVAGLGSFLQGRTWEKGGVVPHLRTILDDTGRPMMFINFNTDMGDGWEWSNAQDYPGYIKYTALAYRMGINEIIYALTH